MPHSDQLSKIMARAFAFEEAGELHEARLAYEACVALDDLPETPSVEELEASGELFVAWLRYSNLLRKTGPELALPAARRAALRIPLAQHLGVSGILSRNHA